MARAVGRAGVVASGDDPVFAALDDWGMVHGASGDGTGYVVTCPWIDQHTGRDDTGAAYWPGGGFKCWHGHCDQKGPHDVRWWVDKKLRAERGRGLPGWGFEGADDSQIKAFWDVLAAGRVPTSRDVTVLSRVPNVRDVATMLAAAGDLLGTNSAAIVRDITRARKAQRRQAFLAHKRAEKAKAGTVVPLPAGLTAPVPLAEAQARMEREIAALGAVSIAADGTMPAQRAARQRGRRAP